MAERIILYGNFVRIDRHALDENNQYDIAGVHEILRFNVSSFLLKMENAETPLTVPVGTDDYKNVLGERVYYLHFVLQLKSGNDVDYKRFRLILSRNGIEGVEKF